MIHAFYVELLLALSLRRSRVKLVAGTRLSSSLSSVNQIVASVEEVCPRAVSGTALVEGVYGQFQKAIATRSCA
jgi:hypothetical protein